MGLGLTPCFQGRRAGGAAFLAARAAPTLPLQVRIFPSRPEICKGLIRLRYGHTPKAMKRFPVVTLAGLVTAALLAALGSASSGESSGRPTLSVVDQRPFTVQGRHFRSRERVKVTLYKQQESVRTRRVTASSSGVFSTVLQEAAVDRCDMIFVRAVGARGSDAVLKLLPRPACRSTRLGGSAASARTTAPG